MDKGGILTKKKKYPPIVPVPDDPENRHLTKAEFVAKRKKAKERSLKMATLQKDFAKEDKEEKRARKTTREELRRKGKEKNKK